MSIEITADQHKILLDAVALSKLSTVEEALDKALQMLQKRNEFLESLVRASAEFEAGLSKPAEEVFDHLEKRIRDEIERQRSGSK
jgi:hypothetical protein